MDLPDTSETTTFPPRNSQGRPVVPRLEDPSKTWTLSRPSSFGKLLLDDSMIEAAYRRKILRGAALQPAIAEQVIPLDLTDRDEKRMIDDLVEQAGKAGGDGVRADLGTSMHHVLEQYLTTGVVRAVAPKYKKIRDKMIQLVVDYDIVPVSNDWVEPFLVNYTRKTAGSPDLIGRLGGTMTPAVFDLKTGAYDPQAFDLPISQSIQTYLYASSTHRWDEGVELPTEIDIEIDQTTAYIIWAPLEGDEARLYEMDLEIAADLTDLAQRVRESRRKSTKDAITKLVALPSGSTPRPDASTSESTPGGAQSRDGVTEAGTADDSDSSGQDRREEGGTSQAGPATSPLGSDDTARQGSIKRRLERAVRAGVDRSFIGGIRSDAGLPKLAEATGEDLDGWENIASTVELGANLTAPTEDRIEMVVRQLKALDPPIYDLVEQHAKAADVPNLRQAKKLQDRHLDVVEQLISQAIDGRLEPLKENEDGSA